MKWLSSFLSWGFTCLAVALLSLLVGSFLFNAKAKANSPYCSDCPPGYTVCNKCNATINFYPGTCGPAVCGGCPLGGTCPPFVPYSS
jgi:hypothetical protein